MPSARHGKVAQLLSQGARPGQNANVEAPCRGKVASRSAEMGVQVGLGFRSFSKTRVRWHPCGPSPHLDALTSCSFVLLSFEGGSCEEAKL